MGEKAKSLDVAHCKGCGKISLRHYRQDGTMISEFAMSHEMAFDIAKALIDAADAVAISPSKTPTCEAVH